MGVQITAQLLTFALSILLGACLGLLYDLLRAVRLRLPRLTALLDGVYCLAAGAATALFVLRRGAGELRIFLLLGLLGGAVLFFCTCAPALRPVWTFWVDTLAELLHVLALPGAKSVQFLEKCALFAKSLFYFAGKYATMEADYKRGGRLDVRRRREKAAQTAHRRRVPDRDRDPGAAGSPGPQVVPHPSGYSRRGG